jgi:hypothetical protein
MDELQPGEHAEVTTHLDSCAECATAFRELKVTGRALQAIPTLKAVKATNTLHAKIMKDAREESEKIIKLLPPDKRLKAERRRALRDAAQAGAVDEGRMAWPQVAAALAVLAVLVLLGFYFIYRGFGH